MPTDAENIATIRSGLLAALATDSANPKPSYSIGNQSVDRNAWRANLLEQIKGLNEIAGASDPFEIHVTGIT